MTVLGSNQNQPSQASRSDCLHATHLLVDLVQSLNLGPIWQASDSLSPRAPGSARRPFLKICTRTISIPCE